MNRTSARTTVFVQLAVICSLAATLSGCGFLAGGTGSSGMAVSPSTANVRVSETQQFTAEGLDSPAASATPKATTPSSATAVWAVDGVVGGNSTVGTISTTGLYTAPAALPKPSQVTVTATNASDATRSAQASVSLENPVPAVQSAAPGNINVGSFTLTVTGSKFVKGAEVQLNGKAIETTFVSATKLTAAGTVEQTGKAKLAVKNPDPGSATSNDFMLQVDPALTVKVTVTPATAKVRNGSIQNFSAAVAGTSNTTVTWSVNGVVGGNTTLGTVSTAGRYTAPAGVPNPNPVKVTATSAADTRASGAGTVTVQNAVPVITSVSPTLFSVGNISLTVNGRFFASGAVVVFGGQMLTTKFVSSTQLTATGTATSQQVGQVPVLVMNPDPGSADSNSLTAQVTTGENLINATVAARFLEQSSWGPTPVTMAQVQQLGIQPFLAQQFSAPISTYKTPGSTDDLSFIQKQFFVNATQGQDQLRQRVSFALSEIMVVSAVKIGDPKAFSLWMNMLQNDAFGNFSTLLKDVTLSSTMGYYLDMGNNDGCTGCSPNENYAREIMQLFSIGLVQLNPDGTPQLDGSGMPIPTYSQDTIKGLAHVFTGWSYPPASGGFYSYPNFTGAMVPYQTHYDKGAKLLLNGVTLPAGGNISTDLDAALQNIFTHPNVGPFISKQLIQKLVTSNPSPDYVGRVTQVFNDNGSGVRGDLKSVVTAILLDPEARRGDDPAQLQSSDGHLKEPLLFMEELLRAVNATTDGVNLMYYASDMRQEPFVPPTVFNFYPPDYKLPGTQLLGPEFKILNSSTTVSRINFVNTLIYGGVSDTTKVNLSAYVTAAADTNKLLDMVSVSLMHGQMSDSMRSTLVTALSGLSTPTDRAKAALYLVGSSSQFQVQH